MTLMVSHNDSFVTLSPLCPPVTSANAPLCCHHQELQPNNITIVTRNIKQILSSTGGSDLQRTLKNKKGIIYFRRHLFNIFIISARHSIAFHREILLAARFSL